MSIKLQKLSALSLTALLLLSGCGGSDDGFNSNIVGIWDDTSNGDIFYTVVDSNGYIRGYDYQADEFGTGENCYTNGLAAEGITSARVESNGNDFNLVATAPEGTIVVAQLITLTASGNELTYWDTSNSQFVLSADGSTVTATANKNTAAGRSLKTVGISEADFNLCSSNAVAIQNDDAGAVNTTRYSWTDSLANAFSQ